jgi:hypothetical protein
VAHALLISSSSGAQAPTEYRRTLFPPDLF